MQGNAGSADQASKRICPFKEACSAEQDLGVVVAPCQAHLRDTSH